MMLLVAQEALHKRQGVCQQPYESVGFSEWGSPAAQVHVVRHPLDVVLSCYAQPFEGRGTPWAWDLQGAPAS